MTEPRPLSTELLDALDTALTRVNASVRQRLRPGISRAEATAQLDGLPVSDELALWWTWHNGVPDFDRTGWIGGWVPLGVDDALYMSRKVNRVDADLQESDPSFPGFWRPDWVMVFADIGMTGIACDCSGPPDRCTPVHYHDPMSDHDPMRPYLPSLGELIALWIDVLDAGLWRTDDSGAFIYRGMTIHDEFAQHFPDRDRRLGELIAT